jgi:hypothetical protein
MDQLRTLPAVRDEAFGTPIAAPVDGTPRRLSIPVPVRRDGTTLAWSVGVVVALVVVVSVAGAWLDPRFDYLVDDGSYHSLRVAVLDSLLRRGDLFPRWWPDIALGYGYPLLNFYSPGIYYVAEAFHLLGASTYRALHFVAVTAVLVGALGAYALGAVAFRSRAAAPILAIAYVGAPYPFVANLYNRSAFPEAMGLALLPWLIAAGDLAVRDRSRTAQVGLAIALVLLVLVHTLTAFVGAGIVLLWIGAALVDAPRATRRAGAVAAARGLVLGAALGAFFWVPALAEHGAVHAELGMTTGAHNDPRTWLFDSLRPGPARTLSATAEPYRLTPGPIDLNWVYPHFSIGIPGPAKVGVAQALLWVVSLVAASSAWLIVRRRRDFAVSSGVTSQRFPAARVGLCLALVVAGWFLNVTWSDGVWRFLGPLQVIQYPWRLYGPLALALAVAGAGAFAWLAQLGRRFWWLALLLAIFVAVNGRGGHSWEGRRGDPARLQPVATRLRAHEAGAGWDGTLSIGEYLPRSVVLPDPMPEGWSWKLAYESVYPSGGWVAGRVWPFSPAVDVRQVWDTPTSTVARVAVAGDAPAELAFRTLVFPGWRAYLDGRPATMRAAPYDAGVSVGHGFAIVAVPPGEHDVQLTYGPTFPHTMGTLLTIVGLGSTAALLWWPRRRLVLAAAAVTGVVAAGALVLDLRPRWNAPAPPGRETAALVLDLGADVKEGRGARIGAPDGNRLGSFVDDREETIAGHGRRWLYMHPPSEVEVQLDVPPDAVFQAGLGVDPRGWDEPDADGVRFLLEVTDAAGTRKTLLDETLQPQVRPQDRGWRFAEVGLEAYAGQRVTLTLRTEGRGTPLFDWAGWATPAVYVDRSVRYPPPSSVAPALGFVPWRDQASAGLSLPSSWRYLAGDAAVPG